MLDPNRMQSFGLVSIRFKSLVVFLIIVMLLGPAIAITGGISNNDAGADNNIGSEPRSVRQPNVEHEPNNDFANSDIIQYDPSGTTHIFLASVGSTDSSDFWRLDCDRGNPTGLGSSNPDKIRIILSFNETNQGSNGVYMTIYDAKYHRLGQSVVAKELDPVDILLIAQVNPYFYIEIKSNPPTQNFQYIMSIINETEETNPAFGDNEQFLNATTLNITKGGTLNGLEQYLDKSYDFADFYKFDAIKNQKIEIDMKPSRNSQDDFDMFLFTNTQAGTWVDSSEGIQQNEKIVFYSPGETTYYLRVAVKNIGDINLENMGNYKLTYSGNLPPQWNTSFPKQYIMDEDGPDLLIPITQAYYEKNLGDDIYIEVFDPNLGTSGDWRNIDEFTSIGLQNLTIKTQGELLKELRVKAKPNKFGTDIMHIRATDNLLENYTYQDIKIIIRPTNDAPILNGTNNWKIVSGLTPSNNGDKITGQEGSLFECWVTAYEPHDPFDVITFYDDSELFDINPNTGKISFTATYHFTGEYNVKITASDNGTPQKNTTKDFLFVIEPSDNFPEVELLGPNDNSIVFTLNPQFTWQQVNEDYEDVEIYYEFYLSKEENLIKQRDSSALKEILTDTTVITLNESLEDKTNYYWTVIPNDGLHLGQCKSGIYSFEIDTKIERPSVILKSPINDQILNTDTVTLQWDLSYSAKNKVSYDVYFGVSLEELSDPLRAPTATIDQMSYEIKNLYFERNYYWKVRPHTQKVVGDDSEIFSFFVTKKVPTIKLLNPVNNSIQLPQDTITLTWNINYSQPGKITCILFWGTTPTFDEADGINLGSNQSYTLTGLERRSYYWKVVPYLDTLLGFESEVWSFSIKEVQVPEAVIKDPLNTTLYSTGDTIVLVLSWRVEYEGSFEFEDVWYEVFLDNSTNVVGNMEKLTKETQYKQSFYTVVLPFEENITYYWYVIPHLKTDEGPITGICKQGVVYFTFGEPEKYYALSLKLNTNQITIEPGTQKIVHFITKNLGNQKTTVDITTDVEGTDQITANTGIKTDVLDMNQNKNISLTILVLAAATPGNYNITIEATAQESTIVKASDVIMVTVVKEGAVNGNGDDNGEGSDDPTMMIVGIIIVVIIVVVLLVLFMIIQRNKAEKRRREEKRRTEQRKAAEKKAKEEDERSRYGYVAAPSSPAVKVSAYKPSSIAPMHDAKPAVSTIKPSEPKKALPSAQPMPATAKATAKPKAAATTATATPAPAKPAAAKPAAVKAVVAKPATATATTATPVPAKPVKAVPATAQPAQAKPKPAQPAQAAAKAVKPKESNEQK